MTTHPMAIASLSSSLLAYASAFIGSATLIYPALAVAAFAVVAGVFAWRAIRAEPSRYGGQAIALAGLLSGAGFLLLGLLIIRLSSAPALG